MKKSKIYIFAALSLIFHFSVMTVMDFIKIEIIPLKLSFEETKPLNILDLRTVGIKKGIKDAVPLQRKAKREEKDRISAKDLSFNPIENIPLEKFEKKTRPGKAALLKKQEKKLNPKLSINNSKIKSFLADDSYNSSSAAQLARLDDAEVLFDLEVPKGVAEDELNKHELVFYSFRKRTALAYVNSFQKQLNKFEMTNPHLRFPLTSQPETIAGKITYDRNGDILRIETLKYTQIEKLQDFFMNVLQDMSSLPNPPEEVINESDQFVINFVLSVNS